MVWNDKLGRGIRTVSNGFDGSMIFGTRSIITKGRYPKLQSHILQTDKVGLGVFYSVIARESMKSASMDGKLGWNHDTFWTETWANYLTKNYFLHRYTMLPENIIQDISIFNNMRLRMCPFLF